MIESVLVVLSRPHAGLDDEFNDWYSNVHLLFNGLFWMVWASANVDGQQDARSILTDHEGLY